MHVTETALRLSYYCWKDERKGYRYSMNSDPTIQQMLDISYNLTVLSWRLMDGFGRMQSMHLLK